MKHSVEQINGKMEVIALGHPLGATKRIMTTLIQVHEKKIILNMGSKQCEARSSKRYNSRKSLMSEKTYASLPIVRSI